VRVVLLQELERWEKLNMKMGRSLVDLRRALIGEIGMDNELDNISSSLANGQLPTPWRKLTSLTEKSLGSWMLFHLRRFTQYKSWVENGEPKVMWLSGLHIPETYTAALVQTTCRKYVWPLDKSTLYTKVTKMVKAEEVVEKPEDGCYIEGLYLEGADWDFEQSCLAKQRPKVLVVEIPILQVIPIEQSKLKLQNTLQIPLYITQARRNAMGVGLVMTCDITTYQHSSHWVLQGVALSLNIAD